VKPSPATNAVGDGTESRITTAPTRHNHAIGANKDPGCRYVHFMWNSICYALGMELALPNSQDAMPGGWTRESLLAHVIPLAAMFYVDEYELRLIMHSDVPIDCPHDVEGEFVLMVTEGRGGPIRAELGDPIIAAANALGHFGELPAVLAPVLIGPALGAERSLILPPDCFTPLRAAAFPADHPLHGVALVPAAEVKKLLLDTLSALDEVAHFVKLLDLCIRDRVVLSVQATK
jgi:hypothetical protein